jgi:hypothetical protein
VKSKRRQRIENLLMALGIFPPARNVKDAEATARFRVAYRRVKKLLRKELEEAQRGAHPNVPSENRLHVERRLPEA